MKNVTEGLRLLWIIVVTLAISGVLALCFSNWERYVANPTVVSLEKDFRNWHNPFPGTTGCFVNRLDGNLAEKYIKEKWGVDNTDEKYDYYLSFLNSVANISYANMMNLTQFQGDNTLKYIDMLDLALKVYPEMTGDLLTFDTKRKIYWELVLTEFGICFTTNSKPSHLITVKRIKKYNSTLNLLQCQFLNGVCYSRYDSEPDYAILYFMHSPYDVVHTTSDPPLYLPPKSELEINYKMQETKPSSSLRKLSMSQRQCRFENEPVNTDYPVYSTSLCYMSCRYRFGMNKCGCRPYFYHKLPGKICDIDGLICLSKFVDYFTLPPAKSDCACLQPCRVISYFPQRLQEKKWITGYFEQRVTFRWALLHPVIRFHRDILFGFEDLVASFGGTASLFFGMSFLSITEIIFFIIKKCSTTIFSFIFRFKKISVDNTETSTSNKSKTNAEHLTQLQNELYSLEMLTRLENRKNRTSLNRELYPHYYNTALYD